MVAPVMYTHYQKRNPSYLRGKLLPILVAVILLAVAALHVQSRSWYHSLAALSINLAKPPNGPIEAFRRDLVKKCSDKRLLSQGRDVVHRDILKPLAALLTPPEVLPMLLAKDPVQPCLNTFIDLGASAGDSLGKFIDAGLLPTNCPGLALIKSWPRYSIEHGNLTLGEPTDLVELARNSLKAQSLAPEDYCYVGVEGNPEFKLKLQRLEARIWGTNPKPIQAAHFYTETVVAPVDGPTVLYLDTDGNLEGSSIVNPSDSNTTATTAQVTGMTLSTLVKRSVKKVPGAHVLIKLDIEGGEYVVLNEAITTLCDYTSVGVRVHLIMESHPKFLSDKNKGTLKRFQRSTARRLDECGITQDELIHVKPKKPLGKRKQKRKPQQQQSN